jgi:hypothetical protein
MVVIRRAAASYDAGSILKQSRHDKRKKNGSFEKK